MKSICDILAGNEKFQKIVGQAQQLNQLNQLFKSLLEKTLAQHCILAKLENDQLTLIADNASWATKIRYATPEILKSLKIHPEFAKIKAIKPLVAVAKAEPIRLKPKISPQNAKIWMEIKKQLMADNI